MYTHVSLFAGLGGFIMAGNRNGFKTVLANEIESACGFALRANFPDVSLSLKDVREFKPEHFSELEEGIDVLSAGFPCQSFSQAGDNLGFDDERGKLFFEIPRICKEMRKFPKVLLLENVPFLKIFDGGARLKTVINELRRIGYWVAESNAEILDSYDFGDTPQRRERLYIVAFHSTYFKKNKFTFPHLKQNTHKTLWDYIDRNKQADAKLYLDPENKYARMIARSAETNGTNRVFQIRRTEVRACTENICPTLTANMGGGGHNVPFVVDAWGIRKLSVQEITGLQCIRENEFIFPIGISEASKLTMLGNAICIDVVDKIFDTIKTNLNEVYLGDFQKTMLVLSK
jgi:DNA (cytosine-5)-methyltransferase 1